MNERELLMTRISETGFAVDDILLYLDTHPNDSSALQFYTEAVQQYRTAKAEYEAKYAPLSVDQVNVQNGWTWVQGPWPWEGGV
ncbi:MAG: spore coat protein CotJB [bacterium]|nr:spore coat protein CotJB [bacterium]